MFVFVSDFFIEDYPGGAELTTDAIIKASKAPVTLIHSSRVNEQTIETHKDKHWIFGNFATLPTETILYCCKNLKYSVIEYDYKYCKYRLPPKHIAAEGSCTCEASPRGKMVSIFYANAASVWFMANAQREIYCEKFPFLRNRNTKILNSVFDEETLNYISSLDSTNKNNIWLIQQSQSWVKGTENAIKYAEENNLEYELFSGIDYKDMLKKFADYKGFIFLPNSFDTCPRTVIEAKLLGCELILNEDVQHKDEEWFSGSNSMALEHLKRRTSLFWDTTNLETRLPSSGDRLETEEETHFKIIIPAYNAEEWIDRTIKSVKDQKYSNFECIIVDDISPDSTWEKIESFATDSFFTNIKNTEKKYALKNINDVIDSCSASPDDVIVILDGDDWFATDYTLSKLNDYYSNDDIFMTYGSFVRFPDGLIGHEASEYSDSVVNEGAFRKDTWRASHLKTFKNFIWQKIAKEDLKNDEGEFYETAYDQAIMLPLLEMAGTRSKYIPEILCVYNIGNPNAVRKTRMQKQYQTMLNIRKKSPYKRLSDEDPARKCQ